MTQSPSPTGPQLAQASACDFLPEATASLSNQEYLTYAPLPGLSPDRQEVPWRISVCHRQTGGCSSARAVSVFDRFSLQHEPNKITNRLMIYCYYEPNKWYIWLMIYNWQQPDWPGAGFRIIKGRMTRIKIHDSLRAKLLLIMRFFLDDLLILLKQS